MYQLEIGEAGEGGRMGKVDGRVAIVTGAAMGNGAISCFTVDGELAWKKDLQKEYGKFDIQFGMSSTPVLDNGNLYLALMHGDKAKCD